MTPDEIFKNAYDESICPEGLNLAEENLWHTARHISLDYQHAIYTKEKAAAAKKQAMNHYLATVTVVSRARDAQAMDIENAQRNSAIERAARAWAKEPTTENGDALYYAIYKVKPKR